MSYNMFTHVFDIEMKYPLDYMRIQCHYKAYIWSATFERVMAYEGYRVAMHDLMRFDRTIEYANFALQDLRHDEKWDKYVKSDKLQQKAHSLLKVTPSMREFHSWRMSKYTTNYFY